MRFADVRRVEAPTEEVWAALHDSEVLRAAMPGCRRLEPVGTGQFSATLAVRVGRLADTYQATFVVADTSPGTELVLTGEGRGRCGSLGIEMSVRLDGGVGARTTALVYDAHARVSGLVARLGKPALTVAGGHLTGCFFRDFERAVSAHRRRLVTSL